jgi:tetratricopeptide (TPR) repeat protein
VKKEKGYSKAELYYELGKKKIEEQGGKNFMAFYELAIQGMELGKHEEALEYLERVIAIKPDFAKADQCIGNVYYNLRRYHEALPFYKKALELDPVARDTILMYATTEVLTGSAEKAVSILEKFLKTDPSYPQALLVVAEAYFCLGMKESGLRYTGKLQDIKWDSWNLLKSFAKILVSAGKFDYAASLLEIIIETGNATDEVRGLLEECHKIMKG